MPQFARAEGRGGQGLHVDALYGRRLAHCSVFAILMRPKMPQIDFKDGMILVAAVHLVTRHAAHGGLADCRGSARGSIDSRRSCVAQRP
jgi:hypothetical protein